MILHNFRQYIGTQEIVFSTDKEKNVTDRQYEQGSQEHIRENAESGIIVFNPDAHSISDTRADSIQNVQPRFLFVADRGCRTVFT